MKESYSKTNSIIKTGEDDFKNAVSEGYTEVISHKISQSYHSNTSRTIISTSIILSKPKSNGSKVKL
jgi:hypothetical protein